MKKVYIARNEDMEIQYNESGFYLKELLPDTYPGGVRNYKYFLKAGCEVAPELYSDSLVLLIFGKGKGWIECQEKIYKIEEPSFFAPDFKNDVYCIHALEDMEFVCSVIEMNVWDWKLYGKYHIRLPFFLKYKDGMIYDQECKLPGTTSWWILSAGQLGRIITGVVYGKGGGTVEKGHPRVAQWNYCLGDTEFTLKVEDEPEIRHKGGDWSYIPAGYDHSLIAEPDKEIFYIWFEHHIREKDFFMMPGPDGIIL